jgi:hypothetical protein
MPMICDQSTEFGGRMKETQTAARCRWAAPSLSLSPPLWLSAWDFPWACLRDGATRVLETTQDCAQCPHWEPAARRPALHTGEW